ncbi:hypothetical protein [Mammaliicoccus vitulinus]|uniref:Transglycosylase n=1 Tax=Mammaliicoccus vitulinus TaxID=71237 RepID=A0A2T4PVN3_9STAP|nr:hypothetical protein [Mammaliicoccus vitulinus]MBO3078309.1 hypothetical protein [Mammaliicoccus vitulinus]PNZ36771.1 hypothetical protein CD107_09075 [Mammaliicoccus vitulinus]PTI30500.1 hypothetical protein BU072_03585 [Mammaliicoccus vitulinus]PTI89269.1 hypothetical protein BU071_07105 [Mammaliicoccus vitulinus]QJF24296.1 hypothetical protein HF021_01880 [Mammaliicoccus vitulinus]
MKKLLFATTAAAGIIASGFGAQADASEYTNQNTNYNYTTTQTAQPTQTAESTDTSNTSEVYKEFIAAGGTKALWDNIVMPESSGNPNAVNELGYRGLGQTKEAWGTGSVAEQTKGMINYAKERYGSVEAAIEFRQANNWW